ncbi:hypothetical protein P43SY_008935 [Pythium insidiosum]|uniref:Retrotransposon gag domain-containing protein n=1 Tax=Pythium insidiosum TaxID=114742 RepID=A0AAD5M8M9_PYTIN|nr:hypothetical protein P43SY_008935 [Pythium insidiosum]
MWSESERCKNLELYLRGATEAWYQQLCSARRRWSTLAEAFTAEFCVSRQSEAERYFTMKQRKGETAREHLWRPNAAARKSRIPLSTPEDLRHHVSRFIKSLADSEIRVALVGRTFLSLEELERGLRAYEGTRSELAKIVVPRIASTYWSYEVDASSSVEDGEPKSQKVVRFADLEVEPDDADELVYQAVASERAGRKLLSEELEFLLYINEERGERRRRRKIFYAVIPGGMTAYLQPADHSRFKPFKDVVVTKIDEWKRAGKFEYIRFKA